MERSQLGHALILNNITDNAASQNDAEQLVKTYQTIGFQVRNEKNNDAGVSCTLCRFPCISSRKTKLHKLGNCVD